MPDHDPSGIELARLIADRKVSSVEVVEAHLHRIEAVNPKVNAIVRVLADEARAGAALADQALQRRVVASGPQQGGGLTWLRRSAASADRRAADGRAGGGRTRGRAAFGDVAQPQAPRLGIDLKGDQRRITWRATRCRTATMGPVKQRLRSPGHPLAGDAAVRAVVVQLEPAGEEALAAALGAPPRRRAPWAAPCARARTQACASRRRAPVPAIRMRSSTHPARWMACPS